MTPVARSHDWRERQAGLTDFARAAMPYPLTFATLSGADLYGFPSADGDYDVRGLFLIHASIWRSDAGSRDGQLQAGSHQVREAPRRQQTRIALHLHLSAWQGVSTPELV